MPLARRAHGDLLIYSGPPVFIDLLGRYVCIVEHLIGINMLWDTL